MNCPNKPISAKAVVIVLKTSSVPAVGSRAKKNTSGKIARPANKATPVSAVTTITDDFETCWLFGMYEPKAISVPIPILKEKNACPTAA